MDSDSPPVRSKPVRRNEYDLAELLKGITRRNLHEEVDFGG